MSYFGHAACLHHRVAKRVQISMRLRVQGRVSKISLPTPPASKRAGLKTCEAAQEELFIRQLRNEMLLWNNDDGKSQNDPRPSQDRRACASPPNFGTRKPRESWESPTPHLSIMPKAYQISMLSLEALPQALLLDCNRSESRSFARIFSLRSPRLCAHLGKRGVWLRLAALCQLSFIAANTSIFNQGQSCLIK